MEFANDIKAVFKLQLTYSGLLTNDKFGLCCIYITISYVVLESE